jgi:hypothetical protein
MERVADGIFQRNVAVFQIAVECAAAAAIHIGIVRRRSLHGILPHQPISLFCIESANSLHIRVHDHGDRMVPDHLLV